MIAKMESACKHAHLQRGPSPYATEAGYQRPSPDRRLAATTKTGRNPLYLKEKDARQRESLVDAAAENLATAFPAPLVLPDDDLALDPDYPPQSFRSWWLEGERNKPTTERNAIYVAGTPKVSSSLGFMHTWATPQLKSMDKGSVSGELRPPKTSHVMQYIGAFYHGFTVKQFPKLLRFVPWDERSVGNNKSSIPAMIGLAVDDSAVGIQARRSPDGIFKGQLNLNDILDVAIEILPNDAYAIILLMDYDLYEDDNDDFCCGRAYGGSRVSIVSTARYHPALDRYAGIDSAHMWPASHCQRYINSLCGQSQGIKPDKPDATPLKQAINVVDQRKTYSRQESKDEAQIDATSYYRGLWFSRIARTAAHELGHCFGMDHCVYYACSMQGTAGMAEDVRQPPYLCPICLTKVAHAVLCELQAGREEQKEDYILERYESLIKLCDEWDFVGMFAGYSAWMKGRVGQLTSR
jgi:archaemetzincin